MGWIYSPRRAKFDAESLAAATSPPRTTDIHR